MGSAAPARPPQMPPAHTTHPPWTPTRAVRRPTSSGLVTHHAPPRGSAPAYRADPIRPRTTRHTLRRTTAVLVHRRPDAVQGEPTRAGAFGRDPPHPHGAEWYERPVMRWPLPTRGPGRTRVNPFGVRLVPE